MMRRASLFLLYCLLGMPLLASAQDADRLPHTPEQTVDIPFQKFVLDNGLTVLVHEDHKAPIVAVNVWYHVGSKNEPEGKTGFAHLFEHLMFNGTEHFDDDYFQALERVGATDLNGTTNLDRTNYFQNVPTNALDLALWMESDRMGHLLGAVDQEKLDEQRSVVQNEKRQGENQPYGQAFDRILEGAFPAGHPYAHTPIGSMEDLNAASLEDVHAWFETYYGPNNAVLVIAGDVDTEEALEKAKKYFGDIQPGPPTGQQEVWIAKRTEEKREVMQDRVPQARIYKAWNVPQWGTAEADYLSLAAGVLASGKSSRLYKRLVYEDQIATDVEAYMWPLEIAGLFMVEATARPGGDLAAVEQAADEELARFLDEGPMEEELERVKTQYVAGLVRGIERIGGFEGKAQILAEHEVYGGDAGAFKEKLERIRAATAEDLRRTAQQWLSEGAYALEVHPFPELSAQAEGADRSALPTVGTPPAADFPDLQRATLSNGMEVILAERHATPLVDLTLYFDAGYAADQFAVPGTASLAMNMLDEGTATRSALEISDEAALLGAEIGTGSNLDMSYVSLSALEGNLDAALDLFADIVLEPAFPAGELERLKAQQLAAIQREQATPIQMALRVLPGLLYGEDHAYGTPFTGSGTAEAVRGLTREDLVRFHETWFKPNNATLVAVGDITMQRLKPLLEQHFAGWRQGRVPQKRITEVTQKDEPVIYLLDRPGSQQSILFAAHLAPPTNNPDEIAIETMNNILGGSFTSRVNMNLREDKGWAYGAGSFLPGARGQRPFIAYAPVQTDKTAESMAEIARELEGIVGDRPVTDEEFDRAQRSQILELPGRWETNAAVAGSIGAIVRYGLEDDYYDSYAGRVRGLRLRDVDAAADRVVRPDDVVWVVVGDRAQIEEGIRDLGFGEIRTIDPEERGVTAGTQ